MDCFFNYCLDLDTRQCTIRENGVYADEKNRCIKCQLGLKLNPILTKVTFVGVRRDIIGVVKTELALNVQKIPTKMPKYQILRPVDTAQLEQLLRRAPVPVNALLDPISTMGDASYAHQTRILPRNLPFVSFVRKVR